MKKTPIIEYNIVFAADQNFIPHLGVALFSLLDNNKTLYFNIYVISGGIKKRTFKKLVSICSSFNCNIKGITISEDLFSQLVINDHFTKANYYRLLIPEFINENKVLYLDSDIVVNGCIMNLYNVNIDEFFIAAIEDPGFDRHSELKMDIDSKYFNSGVMLINLIKWKEFNLTKKVIDFIKADSKVVKFVDQCGLNSIINGKWKSLPLKYNQQTVVFSDNFDKLNHSYSIIELQEGIERPTIIHYSTPSKPWHFRNRHPYRNVYWKYLKKTPFYYNVIFTYFLQFLKKLPIKTKQIVIETFFERTNFI